MMIPMDAQGVGEIRQNGRAAVGIGVLRHPRTQIRRRVPKRFLRPSGKHRSATADRRGSRRFRWQTRGRLRQDNMGIRSAKSKRIDARQAVRPDLGKRLQRGRHAQLELVEIDVRTWRFEMEAGWNLSVLKDQHGLEKSRDAGRGFQVSQIRFDRANRQWRIRRAIDTESFRERVRLDRIAHRSAGAVGFDKADLFWRNSRIRAGFPHQAGLCLRARQRNAVGVPVLIDRRAENDAMDRVAIRDRLGKAALAAPCPRLRRARIRWPMHQRLRNALPARASQPGKNR